MLCNQRIRSTAEPERAISLWSAASVSGVSVADVEGKELVTSTETWHSAANFYTTQLRIHIEKIRRN
jgi:hypothetical protein